MISPVLIADRTLPEILLSGRFPLADRDFQTTYQGASVALHIHGYDGNMRIGSDDVRLKSGSATLSPFSVPTSYHLDRPGWHWCIHFRCQPGTLPIPVVSDLGSDASYARSRMARITALHEQSRAAVAGTGVAAEAALLELLAWLVGRSSQVRPAGRSATAVERIAAMIRAEPDRDWRTRDLARRVGVSPNWLAARFTAVFAMTIDRYRLHQRVEMARLLLGSTSLSVAEIGKRVGLPDAQHFNKVFRSVLGVPPSRCRGEIARIPGRRRG